MHKGAAHVDSTWRRQIENYLISRQLSAVTMDIHPAVGLEAAIAGAALLGPVGALLALPTLAIVQAFAGTYVRRHEVIQPEKPVAGSVP